MREFPVRCQVAAGASPLAESLKVLLLAVIVLVGPALTTTMAQPPGPELFAQEPQTPVELWGAIDYLIRTNQVKKALPYLDKFAKSRLDDVTLITIRNRYGPASFLQLMDAPDTRPYAKQLIDALVAASRRYAIQPERIARFISELSGTPEEQAYAVRHLREAGPYVIPPLVHALAQPGLPAHDRELLIRGIGQLDSSVIPALAAALESPDSLIAAAAATALGLIGDREAVPFLTYPAAASSTAPAVRTAAQEAIATLTGRPFSCAAAHSGSER